MWLRWFAHKHKTDRYKEYKARYERFEERDIVRLCRRCHQAIHNIYFVTIGHWAKGSNMSLQDWSWRDAERLMKHLKRICKEWLAESNEYQ